MRPLRIDIRIQRCEVHVIVVPMFSPRITCGAHLEGIHPLLHMISVIATVALDDWTTNVSAVPISRNMSTLQIPCPCTSVGKTTHGISL